jgi:hypothetical protein
MKYMGICTLLLMFVFCIACKGQNKTELPNDKIDNWNRRWQIKDYKLPDVNSETESQGVIIQNSFPKGDGYADSNGKIFGVAIFWTRIINQTANPLQLKIKFPDDSLAILSSPDSYLKLFLLPDTMTLDKVSLYGYGVTDLKSILDTGLNKPTMLQRTINPQEEYLFYVGVHYLNGGGVTRTGLILKEQNLFYRISINPDSTLIPCGHIILNK